MKRIILMLTVAAMLVVAMTVPAAPAFAKQKTTFQQGQTTTHQGNSVNSPVVSCHHGSPGSNGSAC
jgi:hypothetical protein